MTEFRTNARQRATIDRSIDAADAWIASGGLEHLRSQNAAHDKPREDAVSLAKAAALAERSAATPGLGTSSGQPSGSQLAEAVSDETRSRAPDARATAAVMAAQASRATASGPLAAKARAESDRNARTPGIR